MQQIVVVGGQRLQGKVAVHAAKNAALPIMAASLLASSPSSLREIPPIEDVETMKELLVSLGVDLFEEGDTLHIRVQGPLNTQAGYDLTRKMRASILIMGPLLARTGRVEVGMPGGCAIGARPIDLHLKGFAALGAEVEERPGWVEARAPRGLKGNHIYLDYPSVGATENIMMAAVLAKGTTTIENAAEEPEVVDLANFLNSMGARVQGAGTRVIRIEGVGELQGASSYTPIPDRLEAGTFLVAAVATGSLLTVTNVIPDHLAAILAKLREVGAAIEVEDDQVTIEAPARIQATNIKTLPYPGFPTDMQAPFMVLLTMADGESTVTETVFENRFRHVEELRRMGAQIKVEGSTATIQGVPRLKGAPVVATDLRAGAALVLAGLAAEGQTVISGVHHIDRGYHRLVERLQQLGARIQRVQPLGVPTGDLTPQ
ncbi:MAG: UDP-N-acetylglucosamine 1-carboxyvinyltransferase [Clostridiales bacterium]|nr:UDP-N-acetylglucosamine 1-carboxyvinyltransferase [Clostridiales bacterium]